jgi:hypothetical protein
VSEEKPEEPNPGGAIAVLSRLIVRLEVVLVGLERERMGSAVELDGLVGLLKADLEILRSALSVAAGETLKEFARSLVG